MLINLYLRDLQDLMVQGHVGSGWLRQPMGQPPQLHMPLPPWRNAVSRIQTTSRTRSTPWAETHEPVYSTCAASTLFAPNTLPLLSRSFQLPSMKPNLRDSIREQREERLLQSCSLPITARTCQYSMPMFEALVFKLHSAKRNLSDARRRRRCRYRCHGLPLMRFVALTMLVVSHALLLLAQVIHQGLGTRECRPYHSSRLRECKPRIR